MLLKSHTSCICDCGVYEVGTSGLGEMRIVEKAAAKAVRQSKFSAKCFTRSIEAFKCISDLPDMLKVDQFHIK